MPCYITGSQEGDLSLSLEEAHSKATELTNLLCMQCEALEATKNFHLMHFCVRKWWENHKKIDEDRRREEQKKIHLQTIKSKLMKQLTQDEKEALGL
jgi:hypothetical protein